MIVRRISCFIHFSLKMLSFSLKMLTNMFPTLTCPQRHNANRYKRQNMSTPKCLTQIPSGFPKSKSWHDLPNVVDIYVFRATVYWLPYLSPCIPQRNREPPTAHWHISKGTGKIRNRDIWHLKCLYGIWFVFNY